MDPAGVLDGRRRCGPGGNRLAPTRAEGDGNGTDITSEGDYFADIGDPGVQARVTEEKPVH